MQAPDPGRSRSRIAGYFALAGPIVMLAGVACWVASGTDLDRALADGDVAGYLTAVEGARSLVVANLSLWILGVILLGIAGIAMTNLDVRDRASALIAGLCYLVAVPLAIGSFAAWLALVVQLPAEASAAQVAVAEVVGWFASRSDWIATVLVVGAGPALVSTAGRGDWVPGWLFGWGLLAAVAGVLTVLALFAGGLTSYGFLVVPVGLGWTLAAGIILLRGDE